MLLNFLRWKSKNEKLKSSQNVGNKPKVGISKRVFLENKDAKFSEKFVFRKIWRALSSWNTRFEIRPFALLPAILPLCNCFTFTFWRLTSQKNLFLVGRVRGKKFIMYTNGPTYPCIFIVINSFCPKSTILILSICLNMILLLLISCNLKYLSWLSQVYFY